MITIIGDVHGKYDEYLKIVKDCDYSIQIGDMGFDYEPINHLSEKHMFFCGNHDNYEKRGNNDIGDYGKLVINSKSLFFVRGAKSIDSHFRTKGIDWFEEEELSFRQLSLCCEAYKRCTPNIVLSHDCPQSICGFLDSSITRQALQVMFEYYQPSLWIFGHHHKSVDFTFRGTRFICLAELETFNI